VRLRLLTNADISRPHESPLHWTIAQFTNSNFLINAAEALKLRVGSWVPIPSIDQLDLMRRLKASDQFISETWLKFMMFSNRRLQQFQFTAFTIADDQTAWCRQSLKILMSTLPLRGDAASYCH
jgi:hypothetical protein